MNFKNEHIQISNIRGHANCKISPDANCKIVHNLLGVKSGFVHLCSTVCTQHTELTVSVYMTVELQLLASESETTRSSSVEQSTPVQAYLSTSSV
jgi:hypothetical protein